MFAVYRILISYIAISLLTTFSATASAKTSHSAGKNLENAHTICNAAGECIWDVSEKSREIMLACETPRASMAWNKKREGAFLITCDCGCTSHDNTGWIVDLTASDQARKVQQVPLGKEATIEMLGSAPKKLTIHTHHIRYAKILIERNSNPAFS
ncbi:hypothetical protein NG726_27995 [Pseudomonas sp. MOB-449]|nr:hypothetical protein [Pseudomonas sp. MOB-449]